MKAIFVPAIAMAAILSQPALAAPHANPKGEARLAAALDGMAAGPPVNCIDLQRVQSSEIVDGTAIVYRMDSRKLYVNRPVNGASSLRRNLVLVTKTFSTQLCNVDIVRLRDQGSNFEAGFVSLGKFVPYVKPEKASTGGSE
jgi:hypothetical protein